ncbi:protein CURVATURE THYLAKOID 1B, chloroplastic isoform X2 [Brassica rapa]|uniref:protein CURVATURE THYLAKOID 1B, chloroplastic isoform X2 n=1 Tax=Brassica campestris TaxID=3711 RepID=UPI00142DD8AA|nr:protein CURVATURE THYLAKOID 1B, chloroplastic isoform X2 [Brassica rapa]
MASLSISSSSTIINSRASPPGQASFSSPSCISLPMLPPKPLQSTAYCQFPTLHKCRKIARRNVPTRATEVEAPVTAEAETTELPEIVKTAQEAWEKVEDKYAIGSLAFAALLALWGSTGLISAIDRLPLFPGVFELVGIGYTGTWFILFNGPLKRCCFVNTVVRLQEHDLQTRQGGAVSEGQGYIQRHIREQQLNQRKKCERHS